SLPSRRSSDLVADVFDVIFAGRNSHLRLKAVKAASRSGSGGELPSCSRWQIRGTNGLTDVEHKDRVVTLLLDPVQLCLLRVIPAEQFLVDVNELLVEWCRGLIRSLIEPVCLVYNKEIESI